MTSAVESGALAVSASEQGGGVDDRAGSPVEMLAEGQPRVSLGPGVYPALSLRLRARCPPTTHSADCREKA